MIERGKSVFTHLSIQFNSISAFRRLNRHLAHTLRHAGRSSKLPIEEPAVAMATMIPNLENGTNSLVARARNPIETAKLESNTPGPVTL